MSNSNLKVNDWEKTQTKNIMADSKKEYAALLNKIKKTIWFEISSILLWNSYVVRGLHVVNILI